MSVIYKALEKLERVRESKSKKDDSFENHTKKSFGRVLLSNKKVLIMLISLFLTAGGVLFFSEVIMERAPDVKQNAQKKEPTFQKIKPPIAQQKPVKIATAFNESGMTNQIVTDTIQKSLQIVKQKAPPITPLSEEDQPHPNETEVDSISKMDTLLKIQPQFIPGITEKSKEKPSPLQMQSSENKKVQASFQEKGTNTEEKKRAAQIKNERRIGKFLDRRHTEMTIVNQLYQSIGGGDHVESERLFRLLTTMKGGEHPFVLNMRAYAFILEEKYDTAMGFIDRALTKNPNDMDAKVNKAVILLKERKRKEAFEYLTELKKQYPENDVILSLWKKSIIGKRE